MKLSLALLVASLSLALALPTPGGSSRFGGRLRSSCRSLPGDGVDPDPSAPSNQPCTGGGLSGDGVDPDPNAPSNNIRGGRRGGDF